ncbi:hypothetical protein CMO90_03205 [Candidatus Woesearchaeota archaeon]|jgi:hypothetical protein|nr:hypothetical protein [Candidatus Woesearchaeota archaeon]
MLVDIKEEIEFSKQIDFISNKEGLRFSFEDYSKPYKPNTNLTYIWGNNVSKKGIVYHINSIGIRDKEYNISKSNNTFRIISLGDSFTFGWKLPLNQTWPKLLEEKLNILKKEYEVMNFGVDGFNTDLEVKFFEKKGFQFSPDMIIIQFLSDDVKDIEKIDKELDKYYLHLINNNPNISHDSLVSKIHKFHRTYFMTNQESSNEEFSNVEKALTKLNFLTKKQNIKVIIFSYENENHIKSLPLKLEVISKKFNWTFLNLNREIGYNMQNQKFRVETYDGHPSYYANNLTASYLAGIVPKKNVK